MVLKGRFDAKGRCVLLGYGGQDCDELFMCPFSSVRRSEQDAALGKGKNNVIQQEKNIRERDYNETLFTLDVFNNRELSPIRCPLFVVLVTAEQVGLRENSPPIWSEKLTDEEKAMEWKRLYIRSVDTDNPSVPPPYRHAAREINFSEFTPERVDIPIEPGGSLLSNAIFIMD
jgi:hypothetical protein